VTVDCGITNLEETEHARAMGMDVVVTDHHECKERVPRCAAVVNPHQPDCPYPFKHLAGVGVALKLALALTPEAERERFLRESVDLAAVGTVADVMKQVRRSAPYIDGVTTSGGECTLQNEFLIELFTRVQAMGKTCLIDSNGSFDFEADPRVLSVSEGVMLDVKAVEPGWSDQLISYPRETVLKNLDYLLRVGKLYEVRTILFPGRDRENEETVRYVAAHIQDGCFYKLIRYRPFGVRERYQKLLGEDETDAEYAESFARLARELGAKKAYIV
jgi:pyruvate-formate lyase-activating enzyme